MNAQRPADIRFEIRLHETHDGWTRDAYDAIYADAGIRQLDSFYRWLLRLIQPERGSKLLDVACGEGTLPNFARDLYGVEAYGSDLSFTGAQIGVSEGRAEFAVGSGEDLPFAAAAFDYVTCIGSLEHFLNMEAGVREMARVLRPGGVALVLLPNTYGIINNVYSAFKTGWSIIDNQPLQRYAARNEWAALLEAGGLPVERTVKYQREFPDNLADVGWYLRHPRTMVHLALTPFIPLNLASCFVYICRRGAVGS